MNYIFKGSCLSVFLLLFIFVVGCEDNGDNESNDECQLVVEENFNSADTNGDSIISEEEIEAEIIKDFSDLDADDDGELTENDYSVDTPITSDERAELLYDLNEDGIVTLGEYMEFVDEKIVGPMDSDSDGEITLEEALNFRPNFS